MSRALRRRFASFYFMLYLPVGLQAPYLFLFLKRQGFTDAELGALAAVAPLMNVVAPPVLGAVADTFGDRRRTLAALLAVCAVLYPVFVLTRSFAATLALVAAFAVVSHPSMAIADAITLDTLERTRGDFGRLRLWGSLGFAVPLIALGAVLDKSAGGSAAGLHPVFLGYAVFRLISIGWVGLLPASRGNRRGPLDLGSLRVFANRQFIALAVPAVVAAGAMSAYYLYFTIYLDQVGIADNLKGYFWVIAVVGETAMMVVIGRVMDRIGLKWTFVLSLLGCTARLLAFSFPLGPPAIAAVQLLHALTFTGMMVSTVTFVSRVAPPQLRATGQTLWMALTMGVGSAVGLGLSGIAVGAFGLLGMFRVFALGAGAATIMATVWVSEPGGGSPGASR